MRSLLSNPPRYEGNRIRDVMDLGTRLPATSVMVFNWGSLKKQMGKLDEMAEFYREIREPPRVGVGKSLIRWLMRKGAAPRPCVVIVQCHTTTQTDIIHRSCCHSKCFPMNRITSIHTLLILLSGSVALQAETIRVPQGF